MSNRRKIRKRTPAKYRSPDDLNLYFVEEQNLEYLLCDACNRIWEYVRRTDDDSALDDLVIHLISEDEQARMLAATRTSAEVAFHMCKGHDHALCEHVYRRAPIHEVGAEIFQGREVREADGPMTPEMLAQLTEGMTCHSFTCPDCGEPWSHFVQEDGQEVCREVVEVAMYGDRRGADQQGDEPGDRRCPECCMEAAS